jgi:predicted nucleic acid-binding Zn ribbon protein
MYDSTLVTPKECQDKINHAMERLRDEMVLKWFVICFVILLLLWILHTVSTIFRSEKRLDKVEERLRWLQPTAHLA